VHPKVLVELVVDPATDGPRWRHPARFVRLRPDLHSTDLQADDGAPDDSAPSQHEPVRHAPGHP
jgi:hypothetical protein